MEVKNMPPVEPGKVRCRIDVLPDLPAQPVKEGVHILDLVMVPTPGMTLIIKEPGKGELIYGVVVSNLVLYEDGSQLVGLGCKRASTILAAGPAALQGLNR